MAITKAAKKAIKRSKKNYEINLMYKLNMKKSIKGLLKALNENKDKKDLMLLLQKAYSSIDKAAKKGIIKKQTAARKKSRLAKKIA